MFLREPQHVTAIGNLADYKAYLTLFSLLFIDVGPSTEPGVAAMLPPGLLLSSGVKVLCCAWRSCEDTIYRGDGDPAIRVCDLGSRPGALR